MDSSKYLCNIGFLVFIYNLYYLIYYISALTVNLLEILLINSKYSQQTGTITVYTEQTFCLDMSIYEGNVKSFRSSQQPM